MLVEGVVTRIGAKQVKVSVRRQGGCGRCNEPGGCGGGDNSCQEYLLDNPGSVVEGARVQIELPDGMAFKAAGLAYLVPLVLMLGASLLARSVGLSEPVMFGACLGGGALGLLGVRWALRQGWLAVAQPRIVRVAG